MNHEPRDTTDFADDERGTMTMEERAAWVYGTVVIATTSAYFIVVIPRAVGNDVSTISWVTPLLWCLGISIAATILGSILTAVGSAVGLAARGKDPEVELSSDVRDKEISQRADRRAYRVWGFGIAVTLVLAMLHADTFWIGSWLLLIGSVGALVEVSTKIRAYRRGF